jgi:hypothetical protein
MTSLHTSDRAITQRQPATANLLISSLDRSSGTTAGAFSISRANSMLNGFFTRIAVPEVVLDWNIPNVYDISGDYLNIGSGLVYNCILSIDISGGSSNNIVKIPIGTYTVASVLDTIVARVNAAAIGTTLSVTQAGAAVTLTGTTAYRFSPTSVYNRLVWTQLGFATSTTYSTAGVTKTIYTSAAVTTSAQATPNLFRILGSFGAPNLEQIQYLDFVSYKLTNNQRLKDASTATSTRDILCRWYLTAGTQNPLPVDKYGFVIYPQYQQFSERRTFSPPKQINWETNMPIGQLSFEVWATDLQGSTFQLNSQGYEWLMTLHVSEN